MHPRIPRNTIAPDAATAELLRNLGERHIEVASNELNVVGLYISGESIPESVPYRFPLNFHGSEMPMYPAHHDFFSEMANVLFEEHFAH